MGSDYGRIHRLLKILAHVQGGSGWTAGRLALECGTTERSIYRDLKMLQGAGVPYFFDKQTKGYAVAGNFFMPAVSLTLEESLALVALADQVGGKEQVPFMKGAARAIQKIRCNLPRPVQSELDKIDHHLAIHLAAAHPPESSADVYETVRRAIMSRRALECRYDSLSGNGSKSNTNGVFRFEPYALFFGQRAWYTIGHHAGRRAVRALKLNRFTCCRLTDRPYEIPDDFSVTKHLGNAWRMIRGAKSYAVELWFDAEFAETIADTHWHPTQQVIWQEDSSIVFRCKVDGLDEIIWWVLSMGPHCIVRKPWQLVSRVRKLAGEMVGRYPGRSNP